MLALRLSETQSLNAARSLPASCARGQYGGRSPPARNAVAIQRRRDYGTSSHTRATRRPVRCLAIWPDRAALPEIRYHHCRSARIRRLSLGELRRSVWPSRCYAYDILRGNQPLQRAGCVFDVAVFSCPARSGHIRASNTGRVAAGCADVPSSTPPLYCTASLAGEGTSLPPRADAAYGAACVSA